MEYENRCRTCLREVKRKSFTLTDGIYEFLAKDLGMNSVPKEHSEMHLPQIVCSSCHTRIQAFRQFVLKCRDVETFFKLKLGLLSKSNNEDEDEVETKSDSSEECDESTNEESVQWVMEEEAISNQEDEVLENFDNSDEADFILGIFSPENESVLEEVVFDELTEDEMKMPIAEYDEIAYESDEKTQLNPQVKTNKSNRKDFEDEEMTIAEYDSDDKLQQNAQVKTNKINRKRCDCKVCGKRFLCPAHLRDHENIHMGIKPYCCDICGKCFTQRNTLVTHQTLHFGKPVECKVCGKKFARKSQMILHDRMHNNEKPFACEVEGCNAEFRMRQRLIEHQAKHTGVRKFRCDICGHAFFNKKGLRGHTYKIHPKFSYQCDICLVWFSKPSYIRKHMESKHKIQVVDVVHLKKARSAVQNISSSIAQDDIDV